MVNVLVYPCSSGVGQEIYFALLHHKDIRVYGANSDTITPGYFLYRENYIGNAPPMKKEKECIDWLHEQIKEKSIDILFPAYDDAQVWLKEREEKLGCKVATASVETVGICRSKKKTYSALQSYIRCPFLHETKESIHEYPVFIKPECGEGSKGCYKINSEEELCNYYTNEHIILEYFPGEEYTVDCLSDAKGELLFVGVRERVITRAGISILTKGIECTDEIRNMATHISRQLGCIGAWFFQIKKTKEGTMGLLEVAPRIPGAMAFHREQGINFASLTIDIHLGKQVTVLPPRGHIESYCCKLYSNYFHFSSIEPIQAIYMDYDDTLLLNSNQVNPNMIKILYMARNKKIPVYLVTRHKGVIEESLRTFCIPKDSFEEIYPLQSNQPKSSVMQKRPALFIDDSYRERKEVYQTYDNIYCYDVDSIGAIEGHLTNL
jgi:predicted ATP-grasp superfamily ATP-dependent carboligase